MIIFRFLNKIINQYAYLYVLNKKVSLKLNVSFRGIPNIIKHNIAVIEIGNNTIINSNNEGYHLNMFAGCKLIADRPESSIKIGDNCRIHGTCIHAFSEITIGNNCLIAANTQIIDANGHELSFDDTANRINTFDNGRPIMIEDNVWIGANTVILGGTTIGEGTIIAVGSVVKGKIPARCIYGGNPGKIIKQY